MLALAAGLSGPASAADIADQAAGMLAAAAPQRDALALTPEVSTVRTRLAPTDAAPLAADGRALSEMAGINYRLWMGRGRTELGLGVGTLGYVRPALDGRSDLAPSLVHASPTVSVGVRYRVTSESAIYADASGTRGLGTDANTGYVNTMVGVEWKPAKSRFGFDHGTLGMRLDSGYRLSLKARRGGLGVYLRGQF